MRLLTLVAVSGLTLTPALAADPDYCILYAREYIIAQLPSQPPGYLTTITQTQLEFALSRNYSICLNKDTVAPTALSDSDWAQWLLKPSIVADRPTGISGLAPHSSEWNALCKKLYRTFRPSDGTVMVRTTMKRELCDQ